MSLFHLITHLFNHSSYTPPHYHPSILISSYVIISSHHPSVQPFILHTTSLSPIHSDIILCHYSITSPICSTIHPTHHLYHPSILISSYVIIPSHHPSVPTFILHTTSLSPIHSDIILCHYSITSPICSTIHPTHHLTITHPFWYHPMSLFHHITHLFNHSSYTPPLSSIHSDIILCHYSITSPICSTIHPTHHLYHPSILISSYVIIPSHHPSVQPFILHITSPSPIHSDVILCHYSISSPICSTIHPTHHLTITHPF